MDTWDPYSLKLHEVTEDCLGTSITFNEQYVEIKDLRRKKEQSYIQKFTLWVQEYNPFTK